MLQTSNSDSLEFLVGDQTILENIVHLGPMLFGSDEVIALAGEISNALVAKRENRVHSEIISLAYWLRDLRDNAEILNRKQLGTLFGKGLAFHIAPANVPLNFAYSLFTSLIAGNNNIVRLSSRNFPHASLCVEIIREVLSQAKFTNLKSRIVLVQYPKTSSYTDEFSKICDLRVVWGGDDSINEIRRSPISPHSSEIVFPNKYSLAIFKEDVVLNPDNQPDIFRRLFNDTLFSDQNACSSPALIIWIGDVKDSSEKIQQFWNSFAFYAEGRYQLTPWQLQNKLELATNLAAAQKLLELDVSKNQIIWRARVDKNILDFSDSVGRCGFFYEVIAEKVTEVSKFLNKSVQTVAYCGFTKNEIKTAFKNCIFFGGDRFVPLGETLHFSFQWDGYDLLNAMSKTRYFILNDGILLKSIEY